MFARRLLLFTSTILPLVVPASAEETRSEFVSLGEYRLHVRITEPTTVRADAPTVVLEAGHGSDSRFWAELQPSLSSEFDIRVLSYDRAGMGMSDVAPRDYDIRKDAEDLNAILTSLKLDENVVLVAHSYAGLIAQVYCARWPESVHGILLLDPNTAASYIAPYRRFIQGVSMPVPKTKAQRTAVAAFEAIEESLLTVYRDAPLPWDVPVVVISSEKGIFPSADQNEAFKLGHQLLAKSVRQGQWLVAEGASHTIVDTHSSIVRKKIGELLTMVEGESVSGPPRK